MKNANHCDHVIGIPVRSLTYAAEELPGDSASLSHPESPYIRFKQDKKDSIIDWVSRFSKKADKYVKGIREHVSLGSKFYETVKGKFSLGARILQAGGVERFFRQAFSVRKGEKLVKAMQCYLSTTAGPIAGMLFVSTRKIAFHSDKSLTLTSPEGELARVPYKVLIPLRRVKRATPSQSSGKPNQKYIQIVTVDGFEFWFMGFVSYQNSLKHLQQSISDRLRVSAAK